MTCSRVRDNRTTRQETNTRPQPNASPNRADSYRSESSGGDDRIRSNRLAWTTSLPCSRGACRVVRLSCQTPLTCPLNREPALLHPITSHRQRQRTISRRQSKRWRHARGGGTREVAERESSATILGIAIAWLVQPAEIPSGARGLRPARAHCSAGTYGGPVNGARRAG